VRVEESKEVCLEEPDAPRGVPAAGRSSVSIVVRLRMKGIARVGYWRQRKFIVRFVCGVSGVNNSERLSFMCSQSRNSLDSCISKEMSNFSCDCSTEHRIILVPALVNSGCSRAGLQALSITAST